MTSLAFVPVAASANEPTNQRATVNSCQQASGDLATKRATLKDRQAERKAAKKKFNKAKKKFRQAKRANRKLDTAKSENKRKKAKKKFNKAKKKFRQARNKVRKARTSRDVARGFQSIACGSPQAPAPQQPSDQLQVFLELLQQIANGDQISIDELRAILLELLPGSSLDPAVLEAILDALQGLDPDQISQLIALIQAFGPGITPEQLQALLDAFLAGLENPGTVDGGVVGVVRTLVTGLTGTLGEVGLQAAGDTLQVVLFGSQEGGDFELTPGGLNELLETLLPGALDGLSLDQLAALLAGVNDGAPNLAVLESLLNGLSLGDLEAILGGDLDPAVLTDLLDGLLPMLAALTGAELPGGALSPVALQTLLGELLDVLDGLLSQLGLDQVGDLLQLLLTGLAGGEDLGTLTPGELTGLLDQVLPGIITLLDPGQLTGLLNAVNGGSLDPSALQELLGALLSAGDLADIIAGDAGAGVLETLLGEVQSQLAGLGGGGIDLPPASELGGILEGVTGLLQDILGLVCEILPIPVLC